MRDQLQVPVPVMLLIIVALVAIGTTVVLLTGGRDQEQTEEARRVTEADIASITQPAPTPTEAEEVAEESTSEPNSDVEAAATDAPTAESASPSSDMEEFVSITKSFRLMVPAGWSSEETMPGAAFVMANEEQALSRFQNNNAVEPGDFVISIGFLPYRLLQTNELRSLEFAYDASPEIFLQSLLPMFRSTGQAVLSDVELVSLSGMQEAGVLAVSDAGREGMVMMFPTGNSVIALVSTVSFPGEADAYQDVAYAVAAEVVFSGAQDALYGTLLGG